MVHKRVICDASDFFRAACNGGWKESIAGEVRLPEQKPDAFMIFLHWLYTGHVELWEGDEATITRSDKTDRKYNETSPAFARALESFVLGDLLRSVRFCNAVNDAWEKVCEEMTLLPDPFVIEEHWHRLPEKSTFSRMLADFWAIHSSERTFEEVADTLPASFIHHIAKAGIRYKDMGDEEKLAKIEDRCVYHEHASEEDKCKGINVVEEEATS